MTFRVWIHSGNDVNYRAPDSGDRHNPLTR
jgi:hypothetical protein